MEQIASNFTENVNNVDSDVEFNSGRCHYCHKIIENGILDLHEAYCSKYMTRCPQCREMFNKDELSHHVDTIHKIVECEHCEEEQEVSRLATHQIECAAKPKACYYCTGIYAVTEFSAHVYICGSRTEYCDLCRKYIILRELALHIEVCITKEQFPELRETQPQVTKKRTPAARIEKEKEEEEKVSWNLKKSSRKGNSAIVRTESTVVLDITSNIKDLKDNDENVQLKRKSKKNAKLAKFFESVIEESLEKQGTKSKKSSSKKNKKFDPSVTELQRAIEESLKIN